MKNIEISREELFALIWERPATEVARELGISDVALGKLCRRLQVPKPPRGYWAKVQADQVQIKPALAAFREELESRFVGPGDRRNSKSFIRLSPGQTEFLNRALQELAEQGIDVSDCDLAHDGIRAIGSDLAVQILILIQHQFENWVKGEGASTQKIEGARRRAGNLFTKLLPSAKEQAVIFRRDPEQSYPSERDQGVIVRLSPNFIQEIVKSFALVRDNQLSHVVRELQGTEYAGMLHHLPTTYLSSRFKCALCVSEQEMWFQCAMESMWGKDQFQTERVQLRQLIPVDLLAVAEKSIPRTISSKSIRPYEERLKALLDADRAFEIISEATFRVDTAVPNDHIAMVDRIWFGNDAEGPFSKARRAMDDIESDIEAWEERIESEKGEICCQALGVNIGDIVILNSRDKAVRIQLELATLHVSDDDLYFHLGGRRFRKDGVLGKRDEYFVLKVENEKTSY